MNLSPTMRRWLAIGAPVALVVLVAAFWWFRPDALFVDRTVDDELDADVAALLSSPTPSPALTAEPTPSAAPSAEPTPPTSPTPPPTPTPTPPEPSVAVPSPTAPASATPSPDPTPSPEPAAAPEPTGPVVVARGEWISLEHDTSGTVALLDDDGDLQVVLADLKTSNGPDLRVILSPKASVAGDWFGYEDGATNLGALKGNRGTQSYDVPDDLDVDDIASVVIWCERFTVGFGAANLA